MTSVPATCNFCGDSFTSKTKLFKHLEFHGFEGSTTKPLKVIILVGWLAEYRFDSVMCSSDDDEKWLGENVLSYNSKSERTSAYVESYIFRATYAVQQGMKSLDEIPSSHIVERPKGFSRGSSCQQRSSILQSLENSCHGLCDTFCFPQEKKYIVGESEWIAEMNSILPPTIRVLKRYLLSPAEAAEYHAESGCSQRVFEYMLPLQHIVPAIDVNEAPLETARKVKNFHAAAEMDNRFPPDSDDGKCRIAFFRKLKKSLKQFGGEKRSLHNFATGGACPDDLSAVRKVDRIFHKEVVSINGESWAVFSISGDAMVRGQIRKMLGLAVGIARGWLPETFFEGAISPDLVVDIPALPGWGQYLAECRFAFWEAKYVDSRLDPRRREGCEEDCKPIDEWKKTIHSHISSISAVFRDVSNPNNWIAKFEADCKRMLTKHLSLTALQSRSEESLRRAAEATLHSRIVADKQSSQETDNTIRTLLARWIGPGQTLEAQWTRLSSSLSQENDIPDAEDGKLVDLLRQRLILTNHLPSEALGSMQLATLIMFHEVLRLLREADCSGRWPLSSTGRQRVITGATLKENGGQGGSFSVGCLPKHLAQPKGNADFPGKSLMWHCCCYCS